MSENTAVVGIYNSHTEADEVATAKRIIETNGASYTAAHEGIAALV